MAEAERLAMEKRTVELAKTKLQSEVNFRESVVADKQVIPEALRRFLSQHRSSGLFETLVKSVFGFGSTVQYKKDFWGHKQKVAKYHDSGKKKTYTHGTGFFGTTTKTKTEKGGRVVEEGKLKKRFWRGADEHAKRADGTTVERKYRPGFFKNHVTTHINGPCSNCKGTGKIPCGERCMKCGGTGRYSRTKYK
jgi:hypothetical protein